MLKEYANRRSNVSKALKDAAGLVFAGDRSASHDESWKPHAHFSYLTGIADEAGAVLLLDPSHPINARREILFLLPRDPEMEKWEGLRKPIASALRKETGIETILRSRSLPFVLTDVAKHCKQFATLMPTALTSHPVSEDLKIWRETADRNPGCEIYDKSDVIPSFRKVKSTAELSIIQEAVNITASGFANAMAFVQDGVNEFKVQATLEHGYAMAGGRGAAFPTIVGGGINSTVLHYGSNDQDLANGDLVCIDSGASHNGYGADISRTIPVSGTFSNRQKEIYEIVLQAQEAAIAAVKPGITFAELDAIARSIIVKAGFGDFFIHGIGHHLGLETHDDCGPDGPLVKGSVITIEPGIYLPDEAIGIRIEDDILVTAKGRKNLSVAIPKTIEEIQQAMHS
ncbi:MAG: Xaa-Pro peptidase family protein [Planctomycetota bacterium]|nr:Xaa-Pro peptidase family protein [Planctomycetota bacterium]